MIDSHYEVDQVLSGNVHHHQEDDHSSVSRYIPSSEDLDHCLSHPYVPIKTEDEDQDDDYVDTEVYPNYYYMYQYHGNVDDLQQADVQPVLSQDIILQILSFIGDVKTMRNFSLVSKMYYDGGGIPEEFVVKTCLMSGGKAKKTIERLYPLVKERSIFPISSRRMLDLATGKLCEICKNVIKYDKNNSVSLVRDPYAIHACWRCVTKRQMSKRMAKRGTSFDNNPFAFHAVLDNERVANKKYGERFVYPEDDEVEIQWAMDHDVTVEENRAFDLYTYMWKKPYTDPRGNAQGPIFTHYHAMILIPILERMRSLNQMKWEVERYFREEIQAPSANHPLYSGFETAYKSVIDRANLNQSRKKLEMSLASDQWRTRKIVNAKELLKAVQSSMTIPRDVSLTLLMDYETNVHFVNKTKPFGSVGEWNTPLLMSHYWVQDILRNALKAPTKYFLYYKKKKRCINRKMVTKLATLLDTTYKEGRLEPNANRRLIKNQDFSYRTLYEYVDTATFAVPGSGWRRGGYRFRP